MKKLISLILVSVLLVTLSTAVYATNDVLGGGDNNNVTEITGNEYNNAQNVLGNSANNNTNNTDGKLPQTGANDYVLAILLVVCAGSAIFAYQKVSKYKNI